MEEVMKHADGWLWIRNIWRKIGGPVIICVQMLWIELCCIPFSITVLCVGPIFVFSKPTRDSTAILKMLCQNPSCAFLTESSRKLMKTVLMLNWLCIILWVPPVVMDVEFMESVMMHWDGWVVDL